MTLMQLSPNSAAPESTPPASVAATAPARPRKTPGEWAYDITNFAVSNVCIAAATAGIAYVAAHGRDAYGPVPNYLKKIMEPINRLRGPWAEEAERLASAVKTGAPGVTKAASRKADFKAIFGGSLTGAVILWWGGTVFAPAMKWMEANRENFANAYNRRFGTADDVAQAHENLKDNPVQNWGDLLKGRMLAFCFAFTAFSSACFLLGRVKTPTASGKYPLKFDWYEDKVGRLVAGLSKEGKAIAQTPMHVELTPKQTENVWYRYGKIIALDVYATAMGVVVWNFFSRRSAQQRQDSLRDASAAAEPATLPALARDITLREATPDMNVGSEKTTHTNMQKTPSHLHAVQQRKMVGSTDKGIGGQ
ncbi:MAG: hypothetical protein ACKVOE_02885 [Rickettsiales bacterium]